MTKQAERISYVRDSTFSDSESEQKFPERTEQDVSVDGVASHRAGRLMNLNSSSS